MGILKWSRDLQTSRLTYEGIVMTLKFFGKIETGSQNGGDHTLFGR